MLLYLLFYNFLFPSNHPNILDDTSAKNFQQSFTPQIFSVITHFLQQLHQRIYLQTPTSYHTINCLALIPQTHRHRTNPTFKILCKSFRKRFFILAVINFIIILKFFKQKTRISPPQRIFFRSMPFSNQLIKLAGLNLVEQKFHFSDGTFFRISTTRF